MATFSCLPPAIIAHMALFYIIPFNKISQEMRNRYFPYRLSGNYLQGLSDEIEILKLRLMILKPSFLYHLNVDYVHEWELPVVPRFLTIQSKLPKITSKLQEVENLILDCVQTFHTSEIIENGFEQLQNLRTLTLDTCGFEFEIKNLLNLRKLFIYNFVSVKTLLNLPNLIELDIDNPGNMCDIEKLPNLEILTIKMFPSIIVISDLPKLKKLNVTRKIDSYCERSLLMLDNYDFDEPVESYIYLYVWNVNPAIEEIIIESMHINAPVEDSEERFIKSYFADIKHMFFGDGGDNLKKFWYEGVANFLSVNLINKINPRNKKIKPNVPLLFGEVEGKIFAYDER